MSQIYVYNRLLMTIRRLHKTVRRSLLVALPLLSLALVGCGSSAESSSSGAKASSAEAKIFNNNCGRCHTLKAAGARGVIGPDLDKSKLTMYKIKDQVMNGRRAMPALKSKLSPNEIDVVANFVATNKDG